MVLTRRLEENEQENCNPRINEISENLDVLLKRLYEDYCFEYYNEAEKKCHELDAEEIDNEMYLQMKVDHLRIEREHKENIQDCLDKVKHSLRTKCNYKSFFSKVGFEPKIHMIIRKISTMREREEVMREEKIREILNLLNPEMGRICELELLSKTKNPNNLNLFQRKLKFITKLSEDIFEVMLNKTELQLRNEIEDKYQRESSSLKNENYELKAKLIDENAETINIPETQELDWLLEDQMRVLKKQYKGNLAGINKNLLIEKGRLGQMQTALENIETEVRNLKTESNIAYVKEESFELYQIFFSVENDKKEHKCLDYTSIAKAKIYGSFRKIKIRNKLLLSGKKIKEKLEKGFNKNTMSKYLACFYKYLRLEDFSTYEYSAFRNWLQDYVNSYKVLLFRYISTIFRSFDNLIQRINKIFEILEEQIDKKHRKLLSDSWSEMLKNPSL